MRPEAIQRQAAEALKVIHSLKESVATGHPADQELAAYFRSNRQFGSRDRRFFSALAFSYFRWKGWVDAIPDLPQALAAACWLSNETQHPALALWAQLPPALPPAATLTEKARALATWQGWEKTPSHRDLFPEWFFDELLCSGNADLELQVAAAFQHRPPLWLRARNGHQSEITRHLSKAGFTSSPDARVPTALRVEGNPSAEVLHPILHRHAEVQDIASQTVGHLCAPKAGEHWWDMCAGAGGKTLHLLDTLNGKGFMFCSDIRASSLRELTRRAHAADFSNFATQILPELSAEWQMEEQFDGILIDAPCSGIGTWGRAPDARWRMARENLQVQHDRQLALLQRGAQQLKSGGRMVYAVCSLTRIETERAVADFLKLTPEFSIVPSSTLLHYPDFGPGIGMWAIALQKA